MTYHSKTATFVRSLQLRVDSLHRALQFYQNALGFRILEQDESRARLTADGETSILSLVQPQNVVPKVPRRAGLYHFAILLPTRDDLAHLVRHLAKQGVRFGSADHLVSEAIYFEDPSGNGIEVYADTDPSTWAWDQDGVGMDTKPLDFDDLLGAGVTRDEAFELPEQTIIGHIHLHVSHLQEAETFYVEGLGFDVATRFRDSAIFLSTRRYHHHVALNVWNGVGAPPTLKESVGLDYFTLVYPDEAARKEAIERLTSLGVTVTGDDGKLFVTDPAGNDIELAI